MVLTIVTMLYIIPSEFIYLITGSLYLLTIFNNFPQPPPLPLATIYLFSDAFSLVLLDFT